MNKVFSSQFKAQLKYSLTHPLFYISALIFAVFVPVNFFIRHQFFNGTGSTDLVLLFSSIPYICIILIPVLCFRNSLHIYENFVPLKKIQKIIAVYLSVTVQFCLLLLITVPSALLINLYGSIDFGQLIISLLCLIFYGSAVISLTLLINEIVSNNIAAVLISVLFLALFNSSHQFALYVNLNNFLSSICRQLSFAWHFDAASKGIFDSRDFITLLMTSVFFILLAAFVKELKSGKKIKKDLFLSKQLALFIICLLIILNAGRYFFKIDFSQTKTYTLSEYSKTILKNLNTPVKITYYRSSSLYKLYPQIRDISDYLVTYSNQNNKVSLLIKDPDKDENAAALLQKYGIYGQQMKSVKNNTTEYINVYSSIILECGGNYQTIPFLLSSERIEYDLSSKIKNLLTGKQPVVNIVMGNSLNLERDYDLVRPWLMNDGFTVNEFNVENPEFADELAQTEGILLVIGDSNINIDAAIAIENYILSGKGKAFFNVNPFTANYAGDWTINRNNKTNIVEMLENWGIRFKDSIAADYSCSHVVFYSEQTADYYDYATNPAYTEVVNYPMWITLQPQTNCKAGATVFWADSIEITDSIKASPYLISSKSAWEFKVERNAMENVVVSDPFILRETSFTDYTKETQILGARIEGSLEGLYNAFSSTDSDIIVIPDQFFLNSDMNGFIGSEGSDYRNYELMSDIVLTLNGDEGLKELHSRKNRDTSLYKVTDLEIFKKNQRTTYGILLVLIPFMVCFIFAVVQIIHYKKSGLKKYE